MLFDFALFFQGFYPMPILDVGAKLRFDSSIFTASFPKACRIEHCQSLCCEAGAFISVEERDLILSAKNEVSPFLRKECRDSGNWFVAPTLEDFKYMGCEALFEENKENFSSLNSTSGQCYFFNPECGCALQKLATTGGLHKWAYKPSACVLYPLFEDDDKVIKPDPMFDEKQWCCIKCNHSTSVFRACLEELEFIAGKPAVEKLKELEHEYAAPQASAF